VVAGGGGLSLAPPAPPAGFPALGAPLPARIKLRKQIAQTGRGVMSERWCVPSGPLFFSPPPPPPRFGAIVTNVADRHDRRTRRHRASFSPAVDISPHQRWLQSAAADSFHNNTTRVTFQGST